MKISDSWKPLSASLDPPSGYESDNEETPSCLLNLDSRGMKCIMIFMMKYLDSVF